MAGRPNVEPILGGFYELSWREFTSKCWCESSFDVHGRVLGIYPRVS